MMASERRILKNINIGRICRVCLTEKEGNMKCLFEYSVADMLRFVADIQISENDGLPSLICVQCVNHISRSFTFKQLCQKSDSTLRDYVNLQAPVFVHVKSEPNNISTTIKETDNANTNISYESAIEYEDGPLDKSDNSCDVEFTDATTTMDNEKHVCDLCLKEYSTEGILRRHYKTHTKEKAHTCAICFKGFSQPRLLKQHVETHSTQREKKHFCSVCSKGFFELRHLSVHLARHLGAKLSPCGQCGVRCGNASALKRHLLRCHSNANKHFCEICNKGFLFPGGLQEHLRVHTNERPFVCTICNASYKSSTVLNNHMKVHSEKPHECQYCFKRFTYATNFRVHLRTHTGERPFLCSICPKGFCTSSELTLHVKRHNGEKPKMRETCVVCQKMFPTSFELKKHMRTHTGEKPFKCQMCGQRFSSKSGVNSHARTHSDERNHRCPECPKAFKDSSTLRAHRRTHSGERPYACKLCGQRFTQSSARNTHAKIHQRAQM